MADTDCRVVGQVTDSAGRLLLWHNCTGTRGVSGAPLLIEKDGKWYTRGLTLLPNLGWRADLPSFLTNLASTCEKSPG
jgi:hypothetical protein